VFERFTEGSRRAVVLAQQSALDLHHPAITVEHLLLGVAQVEHGTAAIALADQGVTPGRLQQAVREAVPPGPAASRDGRVLFGPSGPRDDHVPFTTAAKKAMELSLREALRLHAEAIDTGHILLALLRQGGDELPVVLAGAGLDGAALGPAVERRLAEVARDSPDPPSADPGQLDRIESLLTEALARLARIEARLDQPE
jgi:ATP-dependent Clp protease ATP-binding subunit ClpA